MRAYELPELLEQQRQGDAPYLEFLRVPSLSCGLYVLPAGGTDPQQPHTEDEVYCVIAGHATFTADGEERPVGPGSVLYVEAGAEHRFHAIIEELKILVFFAAGPDSA